MFIFKIIGADLELNRGVAGGCLGCNEMPRPAFHSRSGFLRNIRVSPHAELVEWARANYPGIPLTIFDLLGLLCLTLINAEAAACLEGSVG